MKLRIFSMALWGLTLCVVMPVAKAQESQYPQIRSIDVQFVGPQTVSKERVVANMETRVGKQFSPAVTERDVRNLVGIRGISNVRFYGEPQGNGVKVTVIVQTKGTVSEVVINGPQQVKTSKLRDEIATKPGDSLSESTLEADRQKMLEYYQGRGYSDVDVRHRTEAGPNGTVRVIFDVVEGGKTKVAEVVFQGNSAVSRRELLKVVKTKPKGLMTILSNTAGKLNSDQLEEDRGSIRDLYNSKGYIDAEVRQPVITRRGVKVDVAFPIVEGRQYHVGKVTYSGVKVFPMDELTKGLKLKTGGVYSPQGLAADRRALGNLYGSKGYLDLQVAAQPSPGGQGIVNVEFRLDEGVQYYVDKVNIAGNTRTKDKVIRREVVLAPEDVFNTERMDISKQRLEGTRFFSKVDVRPAEPLISLPGRRDLNVDVTETRTGSVNFGAGFSSIDNLLGFLEYTQNNFDIGGWPRFQGAGQKFRMRAQYGTRRKDFVIAFTEPYFMDRKLSVGGELYYRDWSYSSRVYDETRYGGAVYMRRALNNFTAARFEYRLENTDIHNFDDDVSETIRSEAGERLKSQITLGINYDKRSDFVGRGYLPRRGHRIDFDTYLAGGFLGGDTDIYGFNVEAAKYFSFPGDGILTVEGQFGAVDTWSGGDKVPIYDRLYLGGPNNMRGFRYRDVGPKDENGEPIGGNTLARFTIEYTFPIIESVRGAVFYDVGFVNAGSWDFDTGNVNSDVGIGLLLELPAIGPIRIDYGIPLSADEHNDSGGKFQFNVGYKF